MARPTSKSSPFGPAIPNPKVEAPTIDELMLPDWWDLLPPPAPEKDDGPYAPVPIVPPLPPRPREADPQSRPPEWLFRPPYIGRTPVQVPSSGSPDDSTTAGRLTERIAALRGGLLSPALSSPASDFFKGAPPVRYLPVASQRAPRGLPAMLAEVGAFDPSDPDAPPSGGLPGMIREYLRNR